MTFKEVLLSYLNKETDAISTIRTLSGMFNPEAAVPLLAVICSITRIEQGDMDPEVFRSIYKLDEDLGVN